MLHARAADTSVRARDVACRKVRVTAWRTRTAPIRIKAWAVWAEVDRGAVVEVREVEAEEWGVGAKVVAVVVDVPVVAAGGVAGAERGVAAGPEAAGVVVGAVVGGGAERAVGGDPEAAVVGPVAVAVKVVVGEAVVVKGAAVKAAAAAVVDGRAAAVDPVADPAAVVVAGRDRAVSKLQT